MPVIGNREAIRQILRRNGEIHVAANRRVSPWFALNRRGFFGIRVLESEPIFSVFLNVTGNSTGNALFAAVDTGRESPLDRPAQVESVGDRFAWDACLLLPSSYREAAALEGDDGRVTHNEVKGVGWCGRWACLGGRTSGRTGAGEVGGRHAVDRVVDAADDFAQ